MKKWSYVPANSKVVIKWDNKKETVTIARDFTSQCKIKAENGIKPIAAYTVHKDGEGTLTYRPMEDEIDIFERVII